MATPKKTNPKPSKKGSVAVQKKGIRWGRLFFGAIATAIVAMICALGIYMFFIVNGNRILTANMDKLTDVKEASIVYDVNGKQVTTLQRENRVVVPYDQIPEKVKDAFIATEDRRFKQHFGVDFYSLGRALVKDVVARSAVEGGSTITQQLAKNVFTNSEKTVFRKATEMAIAIAIDERFSKDEILGFYLNRIYFGNGAYGIKAAAKVYFNVDNLSDLKTWQIATLAAMPKAPNTYNPKDNPQKSMERRAVVLQLMKDQGYITEDERVQSAAVEYSPPPKANSQEYAAFMDVVIDEAEQLYGISEDELLSEGYHIYTTMDPKAQQIAEQTYTQDKLFQKDAADGTKIQSSMAIVNNKDGGIVALVGARGYKSKDLNLAASNPRQPGSSFKPIAEYGPALESGKYTPYSMLQDEQTSYNGYEPRNYDGVYRGQVSMSQAVAQSINAPAVWLLSQLGGPSKVRPFIEKLGIKLTPDDNNLAIALGGLSKGATPLQMAGAYAAFANNGTFNTPYAIQKIQDNEGRDIAVHKVQKTTAMSAKTAWYMTTLLQGVVQYGTGTAAKFERPVAGKTGTTQLALKGLEQYNRDVWFVGYTPEWTAAVWEGFLVTDNKHYVTVGSGGPTAIFREVMSKALAGKPVTQFQRPDGVPDPQAPPKAISDLNAAYAKEISGVKLAWTVVGDNMQYQIYRKGSKDADFSKLMDAATNAAQDISGQPGETYQYYVVALDPDTNLSSDKSNVVTVTIPADSAGLPPLNVDQTGGKDKNGNSGNPIGAQPGGKPGTGTGGTTGGTGGAGSGTGTGGTPGGTGGTTGAAGTGGTNGGAGTGTGSGAGGTGTGGTGGTGGTDGTTGTGGTGGTTGTGTGATNGTGNTGTGTTGATATQGGGVLDTLTPQPKQ
jgi:penicillin-binding protein 2A